MDAQQTPQGQTKPVYVSVVSGTMGTAHGFVIVLLMVFIAGCAWSTCNDAAAIRHECVVAPR